MYYGVADSECSRLIYFETRCRAHTPNTANSVPTSEKRHMQLPFLSQKKKSSGRVGVSLSDNQLSIVLTDVHKGIPYLKKYESVAVERAGDEQKVLTGLVNDMGLEGEQCSFVLDSSDYRINLVEAPNVEQNELRSAIRWKVKDLIDIKIDEAALDVFPIPDDAYRNRKMVYVVATRRARIQSIIQMVNATGLELAIIDIPELAMHAISSLYLVDTVGKAFLDLRRTGSTLNISLDGNLYLTRRINTQLDPDVMKSENWPDLRDRLVLELQRSLDYYQSQIGKGQITSLTLAPRQFDGDAMSKELDDLLQAKVEYFNLASYLQMNDDYVMSVVALTDQNIAGTDQQGSSISAEMQQQCLLAIGATLRGLKRGSEAGPAGDTAA